MGSSNCIPRQQLDKGLHHLGSEDFIVIPALTLVGHHEALLPKHRLISSNEGMATKLQYTTSDPIFMPSVKRLVETSEISSYGRAIPYQGIGNGFDPHTSGQKPIFIYYSLLGTILG